MMRNALAARSGKLAGVLAAVIASMLPGSEGTARVVPSAAEPEDTLIATEPEESPAPNPERNASLEWLAQIEMQENRDVLLVEPTVAIDPQGGFLIGDRREAQARRYSSEGALLWHFGRPGSGPGEFSSVTAVRRLPSDSIVVADFRGRVTILESDGQAFARSIQVPLGALEQLEVINDSLVLISARSAAVDPEVMHIWNLRTNRPELAFFKPFSSAANKTAAATAGWTRFAVRNDTIAVIFAVTDSVYLFSINGRLLRRLAIPSKRYRPVPPGSTPDRSAGRRGVIEWLRTFDLIADIHWLSDGSLLVPYQQVIADSAMSRRWHIMQMSTSGDLLAEVREVPMVHTVDGAVLWLQTPGTLLPNMFSSARIRK